ncbi:YfiR family protein [Rickettsiales bacterium]|nr:YfiR family protein [Rickettsiales bacterium]MDB2550897.1 YfiR family protein [Rickettsiales bacterium]
MAKYFVTYFLILFFITQSKANIVEEYKVKASWVKVISEYIIWHKDVKKYNICSLGLDLVGLHLRGLKSDNIIVTEKSRQDDFSDCHLLYISISEERHILDIIKKIDKYNIVTISDIDNFSKLGGTIEFIFDRDLIRLRINGHNLSNLERETLYLDSYIVDLSEIIYPQKDW